MFDIPSLRQEQARIEGELKALNLGVNSSDEVLAKAEKLTADLERVAQHLALAERQQKARGATATGTEESLGGESGGNSAATVPAQVAEKEDPGINFARAVRAITIGVDAKDHSVATKWAGKTFGERHPVAQEIGAAMQSNDMTGGGVFIPERLSEALIPLLLPRTAMRRISTAVPLVGGSDNVPTVEKGINAHYIGEGQDLLSEEPEFGLFSAKEREIGALVPISNKLLRLASRPIDMYVRNMILDGFAQTEDLFFYRGPGTDATPKGLRFQVDPRHVIAAPAGSTVADIDKAAAQMVLKLSLANIPMIRPAWLMHDRVFLWLQNLRDANGNKVYPSLDALQPTWKGYPVERYNRIPANLGAGHNETEITLGDFSFSMVMDSYKVSIDISKEASYSVGGTQKSAFSLNQTVIRAMSAHEYGLSRKNAFVVMTGITWGADYLV
ncbi:phage major capsid protein [Azospirillum picis]|uniref:HK97 family phage major capsid protein n=1 Tax=Azospirillum picis TaxID=488438 RepID=A0ABU0MRW3_9PROT|nr:phage major capsid protein [Azospirillum picis]MBP2302530.1 HK97 family phage major capsid protein [Azospirillum picis]MDQ0536228.1 HK97 family phage major capsid protein [Azospirillum picis]